MRNVVALSEVCNIVGGGTPSKKNESFYTGSIPWATVRDMNVDVLSSTDFSITKEAVAASSTNIIPGGNVVIATRVGLGKVCLLDGDTAINQDLRGLIPKRPGLVLPEYLFYWYKTVAPQVVAAGTGATVQGVKVELVKSLQLPLPSLPEQKRIVAILDEAFAAINKAMANTERNLANARGLFESHLNDVFTQNTVGWVETTIGQATGGVFTGPFGSLLHKSDYIANGIPLVNPAHITELGIAPDMRKTVSKETASRLENYVMREGDIVIGRRGEMGRCALVSDTEDGWLCGTGSFYIKPSGRCDSRYLVRYLRSSGCKAALEKIAGGAVMPNLSNKALANLRIHLPPPDQQVVILKKIEDLHIETQTLIPLYERKIIALNTLKQSMLHQAFIGELS